MVRRSTYAMCILSFSVRRRVRCLFPEMACAKNEFIFVISFINTLIKDVHQKFSSSQTSVIVAFTYCSMLKAFSNLLSVTIPFPSLHSDLGFQRMRWHFHSLFRNILRVWIRYWKFRFPLERLTIEFKLFMLGFIHFLLI